MRPEQERCINTMELAKQLPGGEGLWQQLLDAHGLHDCQTCGLPCDIEDDECEFCHAE